MQIANLLVLSKHATPIIPKYCIHNAILKCIQIYEDSVDMFL